MATQNTREHLIDVGLQLIHSTGYASTGVKEILDHAGVPKGSFYHYFSSKEAFAEAVLARYAATETDRAVAILGDTRIRPIKRVRKYFNELLSIFGQTGPITGCLVGNLSLEVADQSPVLQQQLSATFSAWQQGISAVLREAVEMGDLPRSTKTQELAAFLLNSWEGALVRSKADKSDEPLEIFLHFAFNVLLKK
jgi:TetR/AcrR family transcriptional repressor of nem operon